MLNQSRFNYIIFDMKESYVFNLWTANVQFKHIDFLYDFKIYLFSSTMVLMNFLIDIINQDCCFSKYIHVLV